MEHHRREYRARYLISGLKFADGTWKSKARALSHRLEDDARRLADRAALATLTTDLRRDGQCAKQTLETKRLGVCILKFSLISCLIQHFC